MNGWGPFIFFCNTLYLPPPPLCYDLRDWVVETLVFFLPGCRAVNRGGVWKYA